MQGIRQRLRHSTGNCPVARLNQRMASLHLNIKRSGKRINIKGRREASTVASNMEDPRTRKGQSGEASGEIRGALFRSISLQSDEGVVADFPTSPAPIADALQPVPAGEDEMDYDLPRMLGRQVSTSESSEEEIDMKLISNRLESFGNWPVSFLSPSAMASAGFYYTGSGSRVRCGFCGGVLGEWSPGDLPAKEHERYFPLCIRSRIPVTNNAVVPGMAEMGGEDVCGMFYTLRNPSPSPVISRPHFPSMVDYEDRLGTYVGWPQDKQQRPEDLAVAGLFYTGPGDAVQCFQCGGRLARWEPLDEPWTEHARWSPTCPNVILNKGQLFIDAVSSSYGSSTESSSSGVEDDTLTRSNVFSMIRSFVVDAMRMAAGSQQMSMNHMSGNSRSPENLRSFEWSYLFLDMSFPSSQGSLASESSPSDEDEFEETLVYGALQRNCNQATVLRALQERRQNFTFARFHDIEELIDAVSRIEDRERKQKDSIKEFRAEQALVASQTPDADDLWKENERLRQERRCKVCLDKEAQMMFEPCRHLACCYFCAQALNTCPVCRSHVLEKKRVFFS